VREPRSSDLDKNELNCKGYIAQVRCGCLLSPRIFTVIYTNIPMVIRKMKLFENLRKKTQKSIKIPTFMPTYFFTLTAHQSYAVLRMIHFKCIIILILIHFLKSILILIQLQSIMIHLILS